jgi:hypothetical protein
MLATADDDSELSAVEDRLDRPAVGSELTMLVGIYIKRLYLRVYHAQINTLDKSTSNFKSLDLPRGFFIASSKNFSKPIR